MIAIRKSSPIHLIVHTPQTQEGKSLLAVRAAEVHACAVTQRLKALNCPTRQKLALLDAIIETIKRKNGEQS